MRQRVGAASAQGMRHGIATPRLLRPRPHLRSTSQWRHGAQSSASARRSPCCPACTASQPSQRSMLRAPCFIRARRTIHAMRGGGAKRVSHRAHTRESARAGEAWHWSRCAAPNDVGRRVHGTERYRLTCRVGAVAVAAAWRQAAEAAAWKHQNQQSSSSSRITPQQRHRPPRTTSMRMPTGGQATHLGSACGHGGSSVS